MSQLISYEVQETKTSSTVMQVETHSSGVSQTQSQKICSENDFTFLQGVITTSGGCSGFGGYTVAHCVVKLVSHYGDVIMGAIASQITSLTITYSTLYSDADERKHQSSASLALCGEFTGDR